MAEREKVYLIEDDLDVAIDAREDLERSGHKVIEYARTLETARERLPFAIEKGMTVAVVDGNLTNGPGNDCSDGKEIAALIRDVAPRTKIIAFTRSRADVTSYGDIFVGKSLYRLVKEITEIPR